ncbi:Dihydrofolate reductase [[Actinomadura] parvosata subsp. kistnae]|uniref:Deaminase n=1 Tax=[Actinomadura] parvosata subsp. kistnae TaxID=1909395 RepID=A0A1U9ZW82_9ACTN|nr:dihydrofolate reductase family protein [Nonomuraea sp. ATCC 55076]AQZ62216.1 deaminase [Nonomuraea sp. ATCC 55076]SPL95985.1 Dihydrofolate reductase [Actinomadura parvosata subsp. kistnae]
MGTISVFESVSLDGVMQGPGRADEDTRGGFRHGGWGVGYADEVTGRFAGSGTARTSALLFGRRTYDDLLGYWTSVAEPNPFTQSLVNQRKYVATRHEGTRLAYPGSTPLAGEAAETVARLKAGTGGVITVLGSGELVRSLHRAGLVDEYVLLIHPIVLGSGTRLFGDGERGDLVLEESVTSTTGVVIARYQVK